MLVLLMVVAGSCSGGGGNPVIPGGAPDQQLKDLATNLIANRSGVLLNANVVFKSLVTADSLTTDLADVIAMFIVVDWGPPLETSRVDSQTLQDADELTQFNSDAATYIGALISEGDSLFDVSWNPDPQSGAQPFSTIAVVAPDGTVRYEPVLDMELKVEFDVDKTPQWADEPSRLALATGTDTHTWKNLLGITKAWAEITCETLGANGCTASFTSSFTSGSAFPFVVEPATSSPAPVVWCFPKPECECRATTTNDEEMECATASQSYAVIVRIGTAWFGTDLSTTSSNIQAWACADGQSGPGSGQ